MNFKSGDFVTRKSYNHDLLFRIYSLTDDIAILHGVDYRLRADAPIEDLSRVDDDELKRRNRLKKEQEDLAYDKFKKSFQVLIEQREHLRGNEAESSITSFHLPVKVLHIDGDETYLKKCNELYNQLGLHVYSKYLPERDMAEHIGALIWEQQPQIIVITGHDAYVEKEGKRDNLNAYRHSKHFVDAVKKARMITPYVDHLVIFAGACQSHFESIIYAGANFASSPSRVNIHALDPVYIVAKVAYTSFMEKVNLLEALAYTYTREKGIGGIETKGLLRVGIPLPPKEE